MFKRAHVDVPVRAPIVVTVKNKETGQMLYGRKYLIEASNNLSNLGIKIVGVASVFIGVILPILRLFKVLILLIHFLP
jgi:hypothetical protein